MTNSPVVEKREPRWMTSSNLAAVRIMPLSESMKEIAGAQELWTELARLTQSSRTGIDFLMYNYGTAVAVTSSGAATVLAGFGNPLSVAILSGVATVLFSLTKILRFGSRWSWGIARQATYSSLIYRLNAAVSLGEIEKRAEVQAIYDRMTAERLRDSELPGVSDTVN